MSAALIALAAEVGAPLVHRILSRRIGAQNADLAQAVVEKIAERAGILPQDAERYARDEPEIIKAAISEAEEMTPELVDLYARGLTGQFALLEGERADPLWMRAWRPLGMYGLGVLWFWNIIGLHALNAYFKIALPPTPHSILIQLTAIYLGLYMGGHTLKDVAGKWAAGRT